MSDRCAISSCTQELLLRNAIVRNINEGWSPVGPFSAPSSPVVSLPRSQMRGLASPDEGAEVENAVGASLSGRPQRGFPIAVKSDGR